MPRVAPESTGRCKRWLPASDRPCGKPARYETADGLYPLCKQCYQRYRRHGMPLFDPGPGQTVAERWELQQRLGRLAGQ